MNIKDGRTYKFIAINKSIIEDLDNGITKTSEIAVFTALCMHANNNTRIAYPSLETIANKARVSERTARSAIKALEAAGYIKVESHFTESGRQTSNIYTILDR